MKQKYLSILGALLILCSCQKAKDQDFVDTNTYDILDEESFAVLMYDYTNSIILGFLGGNNAPDMRGQIENMRAEDPDLVFKAEAFTALLNCRMDLLQTKAEVINNIKKAGVNVILRKNLTPDSLAEVMKPYEKKFDEIWGKAKTANAIPMEDAFISYIILQPNIDLTIFGDEASLSIIKSAVNLAVTRFDNQKIFDNIKKCMLEKNKHDKEGNFVYAILECREPYYNSLIDEIKKVIKQLLPYQMNFESMRPVPNAEEMEKVENGNNFMWVKKKKTN